MVDLSVAVVDLDVRSVEVGADRMGVGGTWVAWEAWEDLADLGVVVGLEDLGIDPSEDLAEGDLEVAGVVREEEGLGLLVVEDLGGSSIRAGSKGDFPFKEGFLIKEVSPIKEVFPIKEFSLIRGQTPTNQQPEDRGSPFFEVNCCTHHFVIHLLNDINTVTCEAIKNGNLVPN